MVFVVGWGDGWGDTVDRRGREKSAYFGEEESIVYILNMFTKKSYFLVRTLKLKLQML